jgi:DNA-binding beta-propeller fold protein YncE
MRKTSLLFDFFFGSIGCASGLIAVVTVASLQANAELPPEFAFNIGSNQIPGGISPAALGVDSQGKVYISSLSSIVKVDQDGTFLGHWGTQGTGPGQFSYAGQMAVDRVDHLYVMDQYNSRVEEFSTNGDFITAWGSAGSGVGQFDQPGGLAVSSSGRVYVADVFKFLIPMALF